MDIAIQALLASITGASHGWLSAWTLSSRCVLGWFRIWPGRFCHGLRGIRLLAAHHHAGTNDGADRRLWPLHAGIRRLEAAANAELAHYRAVHHRRHDRRPARHGPAHLSQP